MLSEPSAAPSQPAEPPAGTAPTELTRLPALGPLYRRAFRRSVLAGLLGRAPVPSAGGTADPAVRAALVVRGVSISRERLAEYNRLCGYRLRDELSATYPLVMAFPLVMRLMAEKDFPMPPLGLVQVGQMIELARPISTSERLDLEVAPGPPSTHPDGQRVDLTVTARVDGEVAWRGRSVYLNRSAGVASATGSFESGRSGPHPLPTAVWRVSRRLGRQYAGISGDRDPVHTCLPAARLLGFPRPTAHGCWVLARCLSTLEGRLPQAFTVRAEFGVPVPLPDRLGFSALPDSAISGVSQASSSGSGVSSGWRFAVWSLRTRSKHATGLITAI